MSDQMKLKQNLEYSERRRTHMQKLLLHKSAEEDGFLWSMVDLLTLMLIFFIFLYSNASTHILKLKQVPLKTVQVENKIIPAKTETVQQQPVPDPSIRRDVDNLLSGNQAFSVRWDEAKPVFVLGENITFEEGQAELIDDYKTSLVELADFIAQHPDYRVVVAGHTDDIPINTPRFPSNWELSTARAVSVTKFLMAHNVAPQRISVQGYGEYKPLGENATAEQRQANRRVEITLIQQDKIK